jgi:hypothetical protein
MSSSPLPVFSPRTNNPNILAPNLHRQIPPPPLLRSVIQRLYVRLPLPLVHPVYPPIIRQHPIDLALHIRRLRPHRPRARILLDLELQLL